MTKRGAARVLAVLALGATGAFANSCGNAPGENQGLPGAQGCAPVSGSPWVPAVSGVSSSVHDPRVRIERTVVEVSAPITGPEDALSPVEIRIPTAGPFENSGSNGSLSLVAELDVEGFPLLVSLREPAEQEREWIHLKRSGRNGCGAEGLFCCEGFECEANAAWVIERPSAYSQRDFWEDHQINPWGPVSVNTFPTCGWETGTPACDFRSIRPGGEFVARYAVIAPSVLGRGTGNIRVTVFRKFTPEPASGPRGGIDLNVVLVGSSNVAASRTASGQRNLNALFEHVRARYEAADGGRGIGIGTIRVIEWGCAEGGEAYSQVDADRVGELLRNGSALLRGAGEGRSLNLFMVSSITGASPGMTYLGLAGGIGGPANFGTPASGLVFSSFGQLSAFNKACPPDSCPEELQDAAFVEMGETIAHEIGHFLGLNHLDEADGQRHDGIPDTPECQATERLTRGEFVTSRSCLKEPACAQSCPAYDGVTRFCPEARECSFNHLMWWTAKNFRAGQGDGSQVSADSLSVIRTHIAVQ